MSTNHSDKKISITVVVNGDSTVISMNEHAALMSLIAQALQQTDNTGQPPDKWNLTTAQGTALDPKKSPKDYGLVDGAKLMLNLDAGHGGC